MALRTEPILVRAGVHKVSAAFVRKGDGPYEDLIRPHDWSYAGGGSGGAGITTLPHLRDLMVAGPVQRHGRVRLAEPPAHLLVPAHRRRRKSARARARFSRAWAARPIAGR